MNKEDPRFAAGIFAFGFGKKRGIKEDLLLEKGAAHGFRNLSGITIPFYFEHVITELKIKMNKFVNKCLAQKMPLRKAAA